MRDLKWSNSEKVIARQAVNRALKREFDSVIKKTKEMADKIEEPAQLWHLEGYLGRSRKEIDEKYDYRYSVLPMVFGNLLRQGRLSETDFEGLGEDKMSHIRAYANIDSILNGSSRSVAASRKKPQPHRHPQNRESETAAP